MTDVRELIEVRMMAGKCGHHFDEKCGSCASAKECTDHELTRLRAALTAALEQEEALREALVAKFAVTDAMEKAGVNHALHDSVSSASGGWPGYVRRLWGAMNMARISDSSPENTNGN